MLMESSCVGSKDGRNLDVPQVHIARLELLGGSPGSARPGDYFVSEAGANLGQSEIAGKNPTRGAKVMCVCVS
jgi:hypothetical protein